MRVKLDENLPRECLDDLRAAGHDADSVSEEGPAGAADPVVLAAARQSGRVLLTLDKGLADIKALPPALHAVVLFRPVTAGRAATRAIVRRHLDLLNARELTGRLLVVTERSARFR